MKIVVLERNSVGTDIDVSCFEKLGETVYYPNTLKDQIAERIADADIIVANKAPLNEETLKDAKNVKYISEFATGYDNIDLEYCASRGILVSNVRNYSTEAVAQHTFALLFYLLEHLNIYDNYVKSGEYGSQDRFSNFDIPYLEISGKTWGIIGNGNIGNAVARIANGFGCRVICYSSSGRKIDNGYEQVDFDTLLKESDILSLHCPLTDKTKYLINEEALNKMKPTSYLINVARGKVVDNTALCKALENGIIRGAGLDVIEEEPINDKNPLSKFMDSDRLIITPHMGWASTEARVRCVEMNYANIEAFIKGEPINLVSYNK